MITAELLHRLDVNAPRYTSYPTVPVWSDRFGPVDHARALERAGHARALERAGTRAAPLSLYVHIPFCRELCSYCGCNVVVSRDQRRADGYLDTVASELALVAAHLGQRRTLQRVHLGGGTPTFLDERQLLRLWRAIRAQFVVSDDAEVALEIDPVVTRREQLALLAGLGFNRLSIGVQDLEPAVQQAIAREQTVEETKAAVDYARELGFVSINLDLIYGLPRQTPQSWMRTLDAVLAMAPDRLAVFSLAYVPDARPNQRRLKIADLPTPDAKLELSAIARARLVDAGYAQIGFDHYARPGDELARARADGTLWRDFQGYTTRRAGETIAVGASGISDFGFAYAQNGTRLGEYAAAIGSGQLHTARGIWLTDDDLRRREIITELMCNLTVDLGSSASALAQELEALQPLERDGIVTLTGTRLTLTEVGRPFVRNVAMVFDAHLGRRDAASSFSRTV
jgi:oxygen-independent coproporphyrinogen-3 oxidase